jgi:hypothetical protein
MTEDRGAFKTNPAILRQITSFVIECEPVAGKPHSQRKALRRVAPPSYQQFLTNGIGCVAIFLNQPDSRARGLVRCAANAASSTLTAFPLTQ